MGDFTRGEPITLTQLFRFFVRILAPEKSFFALAVIYGVGISLLSLATPISVQMLINTVANTGLAMPLVVLSLTLFGLLLLSGLLNAMRVHLMEIFGRRFYARMVSEITLRSIYAQNPFFTDANHTAIFNRYFDIITVQKNIPVLLIGGFTLILQAAVGFALVSFYHPLFLAFNLVVIAFIWAVWFAWGRGAVRAAIDLSHKKHAAAAWLEELGSSNGFFKSERHIAHALDKTDAATALYVDQHRKHFHKHFAQTVSFLVIYAGASAALLGLGGWLVILGQLSLGQLVAAELVLSAAFFGVSQLGTYLNYFYDLCAAIEELSLFYDITQEEPSGSHLPNREDASLAFFNVRGNARGGAATLDFTIDGGAMVMAAASNHGVQRLLTNLLKRHDAPQSGYIAFGGVDILETEVNALRQEIIVLDRPTIIETTIRDFLWLSNSGASPERVLDAIQHVGLEPVIAELEDGLDTKLAATGWPLSITETMQLKLAAAMLAKPRVLILNQLYDLMSPNCLRRAIDFLRSDPSLTVMYFSNRHENLGFEQFLYLGREKQTVHKTFEDFRRAAYGRGGAPRAMTPPTARAPHLVKV
ncbi:MAG: ABC transporter ATP-binding protein [Pseudomonadota bacterium]